MHIADTHTGRRAYSWTAALGTLLTVVICLGLSACASEPGAEEAGAAALDSPRDGIDVAVATNEPWGAYHVEDVVDEVEAFGGSVELIVPDMSEADEEAAAQPVPLEEADQSDYDVLVINGAEDWPAEVVGELSELPVVASSTAYLEPEEAEHAASIGPRLVKITAGSPAEQETFAAHLGVDEDDVEVLGIPELDETPDWAPEADTVLILTSVTHPDETGDAAPGTDLLLDSAYALSEQGYSIIVGMHPREDPSLWADFEVAEEDSVEASARADVAVGIPGSVFPRIAAVGVPLVGTVDPALEVPEYLLDTAATASTVEEVVESVRTVEPLSDGELEYVVGPLGEAGSNVVRAWSEGAAQGNAE